jgi:hypothetical protein
MTYDPDDPWNDTPCSWPGCKATGNPYDDQRWCFPRVSVVPSIRRS